jgi:hypothetical protein
MQEPPSLGIHGSIAVHETNESEHLRRAARQNVLELDIRRAPPLIFDKSCAWTDGQSTEIFPVIL